MYVRDNNLDDVIFKLGDKNSNYWAVSWMMYVPSNSTGYWNIQEHETFTAGTWNADFNLNASGSITHDQSTLSTTYPTDTWFEVIISLDLNANTISVKIDGNHFVINEPYPGQQLGAINFYSIDTNNRYYIDDFELYEDCLPASNVSVSNIGNDSADFSWTASPTETNGYTWYVMNSGEIPLIDSPVQTGTVATGVTSVNVTGLNQETTYDFYVVTDCGVRTSDTTNLTTFTTLTACLAPTALTLDSITDTTAQISWTISPDETNGYEWLVFNLGDDPETATPISNGTVSAGSTSANITGLTTITSYDVYVRADCDTNGFSRLEGPLVITTDCAPYANFPFIEDFESTSASLGCWSQIMEIGNAEWTLHEGATSGNISTAHGGTQNISFVGVPGVGDPVTKYVSPVFDLSALSNPGLRFHYAQESYDGDYNELKVYYRVSTQDPWVELMYYNSPQDSWTEATLSLPNPSATYQLAFEGINYFGYSNVIDDVTVANNLATTYFGASQISLYPNPTNGILNISSENTIDKYQILDMTGKEVSQQSTHHKDVSIDVNSLHTGIYFITLSSNGSTKTMKFIKN
ncbi:T9SS type A sorting domain-containing protein [Mesonia sp. K7]|uniref:T9SS type A sorting domain-containing protein n=1 Tax=Mesonia sp. K7 TaxID=2218606 RepID=UPI001314AD25|nr:T9SS type A sorting domain-containing protein [Mesonia sp. K7]